MLLLRLWAAVLGGAIAASCQVVPFDESHRDALLRVEVVDPNGKEIEGAVVEISSAKDGTKRTGSSQTLKVGRYAITVMTKWDRLVRTIDLVPGQNVVIVATPWVSVTPVPQSDIEVTFPKLREDCRSALIRALFPTETGAQDKFEWIGGHNRMIVKLAPGAYTVVLFSRSGVCGVGYIEAPASPAVVPLSTGVR